MLFTNLRQMDSVRLDLSAYQSEEHSDGVEASKGGRHYDEFWKGAGLDLMLFTAVIQKNNLTKSLHRERYEDSNG